MRGAGHAAMAALTIASGVGKSGSPAPKPMTSRPAALSALALASTASVADSLIEPIRVEMRGWEDCGTGPRLPHRDTGGPPGCGADRHDPPVRPVEACRRTLARPAPSAR